MKKVLTRRILIAALLMSVGSAGVGFGTTASAGTANHVLNARTVGGHWYPHYRYVPTCVAWSPSGCTAWVQVKVGP